MVERSRDWSSSAESQPKFPGCSHFRRRNDNHFRCQQCRLNEGLTLCTQDRPCLVCKDWLPEAWAAQAKANAQKTRRKAAAGAKAAKKASEREAMDNSVEIHALEETLQLPSKRASSDGSSKSKRTKTKATSSGSCEPKSVVSAVERPSSHGSDRRRSRSADQKRRHGTDKRQDSPSLGGMTVDGERTSGPVQAPRAGPAPGNVPSPAVFPRRRTPVLRPLPLIIVIISHRAIEDPCHQPHLGRLPTVSHRPVIMREDESATIGLDIRTSPDGKCSCLPRSSSLLRRELSLWSLRRPGSFKLMYLLQWRDQRRWRTARQATARPQLTARAQVTARPQLTARQAAVRPVTARRTARPQLIHLTAQLFSLMTRRSRTTLHVIRRREWTGRQAMEPQQEPRQRVDQTHPYWQEQAVRFSLQYRPPSTRQCWSILCLCGHYYSVGWTRVWFQIPRPARLFRRQCLLPDMTQHPGYQTHSLELQRDVPGLPSPGLHRDLPGRLSDGSGHPWDKPGVTATPEIPDHVLHSLDRHQ